MEQMMVKIQIQLMKEGEMVVVYSPALDLCGYGKTVDEATRDFDVAFKIFVEETTQHGTLGKALEELGWKKVVVGNKSQWRPGIELISNVIEKEVSLPAA